MAPSDDWCHQSVVSIGWAVGGAVNCAAPPTASADHCVYIYVGIWREGSDGTDINACCRSHNQQMIATADDFGKVNLYEYPSSQPRVPATFDMSK